MKPGGTTVNRGIRTFGNSHCCWFTTWVRYEAARNGAHPVEAKISYSRVSLQQARGTIARNGIAHQDPLPMKYPAGNGKA